MWIFDSYYKGSVELWGRENGLIKASAISPPSFYMHLKDPHAHREMIEALEDLYRVEECSFRTIFGTSRATGYLPVARLLRRSRYRLAILPNSTMLMSDRIRGTWQSTTSSLVEIEVNRDSLQILRFL